MTLSDNDTAPSANPSRIERIKKALSEYYKSTVVGLALGESSPADWDGLLKTSLDKAKMLSDFVGIIMRAGFVYLLYKFFAHMAKKEDTGIYSSALGMDSWLCIGFYLFMLWHLNNVIIAYWLKDTSYHKSRLCKVILTGFSFITTASIAYGINVLALTVASISDLPH